MGVFITASNRAPAETQRSGFGGERTSDRESESCRLRRDEGFVVRSDDGQHRICLVCGEAAALPNALGGQSPAPKFRAEARTHFYLRLEKNMKKDFSGKHLYVAFATRQRPAIKLIQFSLADSLKNKIIPEMKNKHLHVIYKKFPDEVHGTIALPAIFDGLKSLFHSTISTKEAT